VRHPLDPLDADEIGAARDLLESAHQLGQDRRVISIDLDEPPKADVIAGQAASRRALAVLYDVRRNVTTEARIDLARGSIDGVKDIPGVEPALDEADLRLADSIVRADSGWRRAIARRGFSPSEITVDAWSAGRFEVGDPVDGRLVRSFAYVKSVTPNEMARPIGGLAALVNLTKRRVAQLRDSGSATPPSATSEVNAFRPLAPPTTASDPSPPASSPIWRSTAPPVHGPAGGHSIAWRRWRLHAALRPREGVVLYAVGFDDGTGVRSVLYRASLSEIVVPYGDPGDEWYFRNPFDVGEQGLGVSAESLRPDADVPAGATFIDGIVTDASGRPRRIPRAIAVFERDAGIAWKHGNDSRRARELVVLSISRLGNYDYGFEWSFRENGSIGHRVLLTGVMSVRNPMTGYPDSLANAVAPGVAAVHHQHFFNYRLDVDVDGASPNEVRVLETHPMRSDQVNRFGGGFAMSLHALNTEAESMQQFDARSNRRWVVVNATHRSALGAPSGFELVPGASAVPFANESSAIRKRARFFAAPLWVTSYADSERYAAGTYPNQSAGGGGLAEWVTANRKLGGTDVVLWYTIGITHNPRPEDWPIMPVGQAGFSLEPFGFFERNPTIDQPTVH
jgi:primary-amine oxidase